MPGCYLRSCSLVRSRASRAIAREARTLAHGQLPSIRAPAATDTTLPNMGRFQRHVDLRGIDPLSVVQAIDKLINFVVLSSEHDIILVSIPAVPGRLLSRVL